MTATSVENVSPSINNGLAVTAANIDVTNGNTYTWSQMTGLIIYNTHSTDDLDVKISSKTDTYGKSKTIEFLAIPTGQYIVINFLDFDFAVSGQVNVEFNHASGTSTSGRILPVNFTKP